MLVNALKKNLYSNDIKYRITRLLLVIFTLAALVFITSKTVSKFNNPFFTSRRDLAQDYLMGSAIRSGINPYSKISDLSVHFLSLPPSGWHQHPSPHSPVTAILFVPLSFFSLELVSQIWLFLGLFTLIFTILLIFIKEKSENKIDCKLFYLVSVCSLLSIPINQDLMWGQFGFLFLLATTLSWYNYQKGNKISCGVLLSFCFIIKYFGWPFIFYYLYRKEWKVLLGITVSITVGIVASAATLGLSILTEYVTSVLPNVSQIFIHYSNNISIYAIANKIFDWLHIELPVKNIFFEISTQHNLESVSQIIAMLLLLTALFFTVKSSINCKEEKRAFLKLLTFSIIANPVSWIHYSTVLVFPFCIAAISISRSRGGKLLLVICMIILTLFYIDLLDVTSEIAGPPAQNILNNNTSFANLLLSILPSILILILTLLL